MASRRRIWIRLDTVLAIHEAQIAEHGGFVGIRSLEGLEAALERPRQAEAYEQPKPDVPSLAARYAIAITQAHPFVDGNKRVAFVLLELFLELNGFASTASDAEALATMWSLAAGDMDVDAFTSWVRTNAKRRRSR